MVFKNKSRMKYDEMNPDWCILNWRFQEGFEGRDFYLNETHGEVESKANVFIKS